MFNETSKFKVGDRVIYETCSNLDQGYPELVGYQGAVVDFGRLFVYVMFDKVPPEWIRSQHQTDLWPCGEDELAHVQA